MRRSRVIRRVVFFSTLVLGVGGVVAVTWWKSAVPAQNPDHDMYGFRPFRETDPWNTVVEKAPVDLDSDKILATIGLNTPVHPDFGASHRLQPHGIPYVVVRGTQKKVPVLFDYPDESDPGPYPIPTDAPIEGGSRSKGDRHVVVVDRDSNTLYELYSAYPQPDGSWKAGSGAIFDLKLNPPRPKGWTSADAAGLPIFPGLVRFDEVSTGDISHALRFTVKKTRKAFVPPARHDASALTDRIYPPMGMRVRLKASVPIEDLPPQAKVIAKALKRHGMILADNGGDLFVSGTPDRRWNDGDLKTLSRFKASDFEVVKLGWTGDTWAENRKRLLKQFYTDLAQFWEQTLSLQVLLDKLALMQVDDGFRTVLEGMRTEVKTGKNLSDAMEKYPEWFGRDVVIKVRDGEVKGKAVKVFRMLAEE